MLKTVAGQDRTSRKRRRLKCLAGAMALVVGGVLLQGCAASDGVPTLTWYINPDDGGQADLAALCTTEANGSYRIQTSLLPKDAAAQREQLARRLAAGDSSLDIMSIDPPFIPELAEPGFLAPVPKDLAEQQSKDILEGALAGATWKDELVSVPFWANTQILWYRKSVAQEAGLDMSKPVTWDQLMDAAEKQNKYLGVQGAQAESMTVWINALIESAGDHILLNPGAKAEDIELGLTSPAGEAAAAIIGGIGKKNLGGPGLPAATENDSMILFRGDEGSFMVNYPFVWPATNAAVEAGSVEQSVLDDIGWTLYPQVEAGKDTAPPLGGINLGVGSKSRHQELAYEAIECITQPKNQATYFVTNGNPPSNATAYDDPRVEKLFPMAPTIRESLKLAAPRPQTPFYNEISTGLQQQWTPPSAVDPKTTPQESQNFILAVLRGDRLL